MKNGILFAYYLLLVTGLHNAKKTSFHLSNQETEADALITRKSR